MIRNRYFTMLIIYTTPVAFGAADTNRARATAASDTFIEHYFTLIMPRVKDELEKMTYAPLAINNQTRKIVKLLFSVPSLPCCELHAHLQGIGIERILEPNKEQTITAPNGWETVQLIDITPINAESSPIYAPIDGYRPSGNYHSTDIALILKTGIVLKDDENGNVGLYPEELN